MGSPSLAGVNRAPEHTGAERTAAQGCDPERLHRCARLKSLCLRCGICELEGIAR